MRRWIALTLLLTLGVMVTPHAPVDAQVPLIGEGGVVVATMSSISITNTVAPTLIFNYNVPGALVATSSFISMAGTSSTTNVVAASLPLHLRCDGTFNTAASPGSYNVGVVFGLTGGSGTPGGAATIALVNGITPQASLVNQPLTLDVWLTPIATATTGNIQPTGATVFMHGRWSYQNGATLALASETTFSAATIGTANLRGANQFQASMQWNTAKADNAVNIYQCQFIISN